MPQRTRQLRMASAVGEEEGTCTNARHAGARAGLRLAIILPFPCPVTPVPSAARVALPTVLCHEFLPVLENSEEALRRGSSKKVAKFAGMRKESFGGPGRA